MSANKSDLNKKCSETSGKWRKNRKGNMLTLRFFFTQVAIGLSDDKIYGVTEKVIYRYK